MLLSEIAEKLEAPLEGAGDTPITGIAGLREAQPGDISFVAHPRYAALAANTKASALVVPRDWDRTCAAALLRVESPDRAFARVVEWFSPPPLVFVPGIHPTAVIAPDARLGKEVYIGPHCIVEPRASVGDRTRLLGANVVGHESVIGSDGLLYPHVTLRERVSVGDRVIIHNGSVIGSDGFGYSVDAQGVRTKIPQIGTVVIEDDVEIGANVTIDRARFGRTRIGRRVKIDNLVQIAHNVDVGDDAVIIAQVGISGSTVIGPRVILAGQSGLAGHIEVGEGAIVAARAGVTKDVPPQTFVSGFPAAPHEKATRLHAHVMRLPELKKKVGDIERRLQALEKEAPKTPAAGPRRPS